MADHVTDTVFSNNRGGYMGEYTVDIGLYDWVIDYDRFNKNTGMVGYFVDDGLNWIKLFDTRTDFPGANNFTRASFTIGNAFTFNGIDYSGDPFEVDHAEDQFVFFVLPTVTPQPGTFFTWTYTLSIQPHDEGPKAVNDVISYDWGEKGSKSFDVVANDTDPQNNLNRASVDITRAPKWGTLSIENGVVTYKPNQPGSEPESLRQPRSDSFQYTIKDTTGQISGPATVRIKVGDCPEPLPMFVSGGELEHRDGVNYCIIDGDFFIGREDGDANLIKVRNGTASVFDDKIILKGDVYSGASGRLLIPGATVQLEAPSSKSSLLEATGPIKLAGLDLVPATLALEPNAVLLGGKLKLSEGFDAATLDLDELGAPLRIVSGAVGASEVHTPPISFASFAKQWQTSVDSFQLSYQPDTDILRVNGQFTITSQLFTKGSFKFAPGVKLDLLTQGRFLEIQEGKLSGNAQLEISAGLEFAGWGLSKITGGLKFEDDSIREVSIGGKIKTPIGSLGGELSAINVNPIGAPPADDAMQLDRVKFLVEAGAKGIPVPTPTPLPIIYIVGASVEARGLAHVVLGDGDPNAQLGLGGSMTFAWLNDTKIKRVLASGIEQEIGDLVGITMLDGYALSMEIGSPTGSSLLKIPFGSKAHSEVAGQVKLVALHENLFVATGVGKFDLTLGEGSLSLTARLLNGAIGGNVTGVLSQGGLNGASDGVSLTLKGTLNGALPLGSTSISGAIGAYGQIKFDGDASNDYIDLATKIDAGLTYVRGGLRIHINPDYTGSMIETLAFGDAKTLVGSWDTTAGETALIMRATWTESQNGADVPIKVTFRPVGGGPLEEYEEADFAAHGISVVNGLTGDFSKTVIVESPAEGRWDIVPLDDGPLGTITYDGFTPNLEPTVTITATEDGRDTSSTFTLQYTVTGDNPVNIRFLWDTDGDGVGGTEFAGLLNAPPGAGAYGFTKPVDAPETFWVYAENTDDSTPLAAPVHLDATTTLAPGTFAVDITVGGISPTAVTFFWDTDNDGVGGSAFVGVGPFDPGTYHVVLDTPAGTPSTFYVYGEAEIDGSQVLAPLEVTPDDGSSGDRGQFTLYYDLGDSSSNTVTFFVDPDGTGEHVRAFATASDVSPGAHQFSFDAPAGVAGNFWVYAQAEDGFNLPVATEPVAFFLNGVGETHGANLVVSSDLPDDVPPGSVSWRVTIRNDGDRPASSVELEEDITEGTLSVGSVSVGYTAHEVYDTPFDDDPDDDFTPDPVLDPARLRIELDSPIAPGEEVTVDFYTFTATAPGARTQAGSDFLTARHVVTSAGDVDFTDNVAVDQAKLTDILPEPYEPGGPNTPDVSVRHVDHGMHGNERWIDVVITNNGPAAAHGVKVEETLLTPESGAQPGYLYPLPNDSLLEDWKVDGFISADLDGDPLTRLIELERPLLAGESIVVPFRVGDAHEGTATLEARLDTAGNDFDPTNDVSLFTATGIVAQPLVGFYPSHSPYGYVIEQGPPPTPWLVPGHLDVDVTYHSNLQVNSFISSLPTVGGHINVKLDGPAVINFNGVNYSDDFTIPVGFFEDSVNVPGSYTIRPWSLTATGEGDITIELTIDGMSRDNTFDIGPARTWYSAGDDAAPVQVGGVPTQTFTQDVPFSFTLPDSLWQAVGGGAVDITVLDWWLQEKDLPPGEFAGRQDFDWITWDAGSQTFSGTMTAADVPEWNNFDLVMQVSNQHGGIVESKVDIDVVNINEAPFIDNAYIDRQGFVGVPLHLNLPSNIPRIAHDSHNGTERTTTSYFGDTDGWAIIGGQRVVEYVYVDYTAFPAFLSLDFSQGRPLLVGTPGVGDVGTHTITVTARDQSGATTSQTFDLEIVAVNPPIAGVTPLPDAEATQDVAFSYVIPVDAFTDPNGDPISYAVLDRPAWLRYDAETRTLFGTPGPGDTGTVTLEIVASDGGLGIGRRDLELVVADVDDAPLASADFIADIPIGGVPYSGTIGTLTANDIEFDDDLLSAVLTSAPRFGSVTVGADGSFDYTVGPNFKGEDVFTYTATDPGGASSEAAVYLGVGIDNAHAAQSLIGTGAADTISGGYGDDTVDGRAGDDSLYGGTGNDTVVFGGGGSDQVILDLQAGTASGLGIGSDSVLEFEHAIGGAGDDFLSGSSARNWLAGGDGRDTVDGLGDRDTVYGGNGNDIVLGGGDNDTLSGDAGNDTIYGGAENDTIYGGAGNDTIMAGAGPDQYTGGDGDDVYLGVERFSVGGSIIDNLYENSGAAGGRDTAYTAESDVVLASYVEVGIIDFAGDGNLSGDFNDNVLYGNAAANFLDAGGGNDTIYGGSGVDGVIGNFGDDMLFGDAGADSVSGGFGTDTAYGGNGNDVLRGNDGSDVLEGDSGDDALFGDAADAGGFNQLFGGDGVDSVSYAGVSAVVYANLDSTGVHIGGVLTDVVNGIEYLVGGNGADVLVGNGGANRLDGGAGNVDDLLFGGAGNDSFVGGGHAASSANQFWGGDGSDTADYSAQTARVFVDLRAPASYVDSGGGFVLNDLMNSVENAIGGSNADTLAGTDTDANMLFGGAGADGLYGFGGDDVLSGGSGGTGTYNQLWGGSGSDTASYELATTRVYADLNGHGGWRDDGTGTLALNDSYNSIENLIGGSGNDSLVGDGNANRLTGGAGNDILYGFGGSDTFAYRSAAESNVIAGYDVIADFESGSDSLDLSAFGITAADVLILDNGGNVASLYANTDGIAGYDLALMVHGGASLIQMSDIRFAP